MRTRKSVFSDVDGRSIIALLCDFRNYKYSLTAVPGAECIIELLPALALLPYSIRVRLPHAGRETIRRVISQSMNVLAIGMSVSRSSRRHLSLAENPESGQLETVEITADKNVSKPSNRRSTGATFVVFNGSLKSASDEECTCNIVEDGVMIQLTSRALDSLKTALDQEQSFRLRLPKNLAAPSTTIAGSIVSSNDNSSGRPYMTDNAAENPTPREVVHDAAAGGGTDHLLSAFLLLCPRDRP